MVPGKAVCSKVPALQPHVPDRRGGCREGLGMVLRRVICKKDSRFLVKKQCASRSQKILLVPCQYTGLEESEEQVKQK